MYQLPLLNEATGELEAKPAIDQTYYGMSTVTTRYNTILILPIFCIESFQLPLNNKQGCTKDLKSSHYNFFLVL